MGFTNTATPVGGATPVSGNVAITNTPHVVVDSVTGAVTINGIPHVVVDSITGAVTIAGTVPISIAAAVNVASLPSSAGVASGQTVIAVANTAVQLANLPCTRGLLLRAIGTNTSTIYLGNSADTTANGHYLAKADPSIWVPVANANQLWVNGVTPGDGLTYLAI